MAASRTPNISVETYNVSISQKIHSFGSVGQNGGLTFGTDGFLYATGSDTGSVGVDVYDVPPGQ